MTRSSIIEMPDTTTMLLVSFFQHSEGRTFFSPVRVSLELLFIAMFVFSKVFMSASLSSLLLSFGSSQKKVGMKEAKKAQEMICKSQIKEKLADDMPLLTEKIT